MFRRSYKINKSAGTDHSFYSFIGALLVFLGFLLLINLLFYLLGGGTSHKDHENKLGSSSDLQWHTKATETNLEITSSRTLSPSTQPIYVMKNNSISTTKNNEEYQNVEETHSSTASTSSWNDYYSSNDTDIDENIMASTQTSSTTEYTSTLEVSKSKYASTQTVPTTEYEVLMTDGYCDDSTCKRSAANMLYTIDHNGEQCKNFYYHACGRDKSISKEHFLDDLYQKVLEIAENSNSTSANLFTSIYRSCVNYKANFDFNLMSRPKDALLTDSKSADLVELVYDLIMEQAMPFFDVGLRISYDSKFEAEITLPGLSSLKTSISRWSMMHSIKHDCLRNLIRKKSNNYYDMEQIDEDLKLCSDSAIGIYAGRYANEIKNLPVSLTNPALLRNLDFKEDLIDLLKKLEEVPDPEMRALTLGELVNDQDFNFGLDWKKLFSRIDSNISDDSIINLPFPNTVKNIIAELQLRQNKIIGILELWKQIQHYWRAMSSLERSSNNARFCLSSISELIPDITNALVSQRKTNKNNEYIVQHLFKKLKTRLSNSFTNSNMLSPSLNILQEKLEKIVLIKSKPIDEEILMKLYQNIHIDETNYFQNCLKLLRNYKKNILSLNGAHVSEDILGSYFLSPYEIKPKSFKPSNMILYQPRMLMDAIEANPYYVNLAKIGFSLAEQIAVYFETNDYSNPLPQKDGMIYQNFVQYSNALLEKLTDKATHTFNGREYVIKASTNNMENPFIRDNMAFRLVTDYFQQLKFKESLIWLNMTYTKEQVFFIMAAQEYCTSTSMLDIADTFILQKSVPAPIRINTMMKNSKLFMEQYNCAAEEHTYVGQFPFPLTTTPASFQ